MGQGGQVEFKVGRRPAASRVQADPPQPVARRGRLVGEEPEPVQRPDRLDPPWPLLSYDCLPMACIRRIYLADRCGVGLRASCGVADELRSQLSNDNGRRQGVAARLPKTTMMTPFGRTQAESREKVARSA